MSSSIFRSAGIPDVGFDLTVVMTRGTSRIQFDKDILLTGYLKSESERFCGWAAGRICISEFKLNVNAMRTQGRKTDDPDEAVYSLQAVVKSVFNGKLETLNLDLEKMSSHQYHRNNVEIRQLPAVRMLQSAA
jgi:hypothetical protein